MELELARLLLILAAGLLLILFGADWLVDGSSSLARKLGISEFVIGMTIVGIGTSTPEMVVSFISSLQGKADMAVGNIIGSNIFNTMLILGVTAMISPMIITKSNIRRDIPMNIFVTVLLILLGMNQTLFGAGLGDRLSRIDGAILLLLFICYLYITIKKDNPDIEEEGNETKEYGAILSIFMVIGGLAGLIFGGKMFVHSAEGIARMYHLSEKFIGITILAGGTSLPELATCIVAALKKKGQLALGNILGSNISNILLILGGASLIHPLSFAGMSLIDLSALLLCSIFILISAFTFRKRQLDRMEGAILVSMEVIYMSYLIINI